MVPVGLVSKDRWVAIRGKTAEVRCAKPCDEREKGLQVKRGKVGAADCMVFSLPEAVRFAETWMLTHRRPTE
jgi:uncharacterized membrane protein (UPF0127 family)